MLLPVPTNPQNLKVVYRDGTEVCRSPFVNNINIINNNDPVIAWEGLSMTIS